MDDFVISRTASGRVISRYGDAKWDLRVYIRSGRGCVIDFFEANSLGLEAELKWLIFLLLFDHRTGTLRTVSNVYNQYLCLMIFARLSKDMRVSLLDVFSSVSIFKNIVAPFTKTRKKLANSFLHRFYSIPASVSGFSCLDPKLIKGSGRADNLNGLYHNQTAPIPERLFYAAINKLDAVVSDFLSFRAGIVTLCSEISSSPYYARSHCRQKELGVRSDDYELDFDAAIDLHNVRDLMEKNNVAGMDGFGGYLSMVQFCCKTLVHIYSGMRDEEAYSLKSECLESKKYFGVQTHHLLGITTKLENGDQTRTYWVTSDEVRNAITAATTICDIIRTDMGAPRAEIPLFASISHASFGKGQVQQYDDEIITGSLKNSKFNKKVFVGDEFLITEADIRTLKSIDFSRAWENEEKFQVGKPWPFATHQFRRSLAIYALSSSLVSLTSLKRQLKHISLAMTLYYVRGFLAGANLFGKNPNHFIHEVKQVKSIVEALDYIGAQTSDEKLLGAHGALIEKKIKPLGKIAILDSRVETVKRFKNGEIKCVESPVGECTAISPCHKGFHRPLSKCLSECEHPIIIPSRAIATLEKQRRFVESLPVGTERITEQAELDTLEDYLVEGGVLS